MKVAIRTDASINIGSGHLMRCLTLADALIGQGAQVYFLCRDLPGFNSELITTHGHVLHLMPRPKPEESEEQSQDLLPHANWLPCSQHQDALDCEKILQEIGQVDWLVVDHYALDYRFEQKLRPFAKQIFVIDDLADRQHECDLLLDQNYIQDLQQRYVGLVPSKCRLLLGPRYALLRPEFLVESQKLRERDGHIRRIFIFFGGSDPDNMTGKALEAIKKLDRPDIEVDVVIGSSQPYKEDIKERASQLPQMNCYDYVQNMAKLMAMADLAIGAGGTTTWERCCLGLPTLIVTLADNQIPIARGVDSIQAGRYLGTTQEVSVKLLVQELRHLLTNSCKLLDLSQKGLQLVDGYGTFRVTKILQIGQIQLREAVDTDCELLWSWANDAKVRDSAYNSDYISWEEHIKWFKGKLSSADSLIFIAEDQNGLALGQIRFDFDGIVANIDYSLQHDYRGLGLGKIVLRKGIEEVLQRIAKPITFQGKVKTENLASKRSFEQASFSQIAEENKDTGDKSHTNFSIALVSDKGSWINSYLSSLVADLIILGHKVCWVHKIDELLDEDIVFYLSCGQLTPKAVLDRHKHNLVVHESDLPKGRGCSPLTWQILEGKNEIPITLFEAKEEVDSGPIYLQSIMRFRGHELVDELREKQAIHTVQLCLEFIRRYPEVTQQARHQQGKPTFYPKRGPKDSWINPDKTIREQFDLLRVVDNERYPAWFEVGGQRYLLKIEKMYKQP